MQGSDVVRSFVHGHDFSSFVYRMFDFYVLFIAKDCGIIAGYPYKLSLLSSSCPVSLSRLTTRQWHRPATCRMFESQLRHRRGPLSTVLSHLVQPRIH